MNRPFRVVVRIEDIYSCEKPLKSSKSDRWHRSYSQNSNSVSIGSFLTYTRRHISTAIEKKKQLPRPGRIELPSRASRIPTAVQGKCIHLAQGLFRLSPSTQARKVDNTKTASSEPSTDAGWCHLDLKFSEHICVRPGSVGMG